MTAGPAGQLDVARYPVSLQLRGRLAVVIGGGRVAAQRVADLRAAGAEVLVVAPELSAPLAELAAGRRIGTRTRSYLASDLDGAWLVLACTGQATVNAAIEADAERHRIWCIRADDAADQGPGRVPRPGREPAPRPGREPAPEPVPRPGPEPGSTARSAGGVLVLGGARSGKSATAEAMLAGQVRGPDLCPGRSRFSTMSRACLRAGRAFRAMARRSASARRPSFTPRSAN